MTTALHEYYVMGLEGAATSLRHNISLMKGHSFISVSTLPQTC